MKLLMISGDRSILHGKQGAFWYTLQEFSKHWERIDVLCPNAGEARSAEPFPNVFFHASSEGLLRQPRWIASVGARLIAAHGHRVMTAHEYPPFYNGIGARRLHLATGVPYALEIHHLIGVPRPATVHEAAGAVLSRLYLRYDAKHAAAVRVVNAEVGRTLTRWGIPSEKIHLVPSFYLDREMLKPDPSVPKIYDVAFAGRLAANKGLDRFLKAVAGLPDLRAVVIGDGPERAAAERLAKRLGVLPRVTFTGWLQRQEDVLFAVQSARIFVMSSLSEGGPRIGLEAMACGMPVVSTRVGVMPDVIRDGVNGALSEGSPADLRRHITALLADPGKRLAMGKAAARVIDSFERTDLIGRYAAFLRSIAR